MSITEFVPDYTANVASQPEKWGFKTIATLSQPNMSYEFDEYIVWADTSGGLFYAHDSGCSCPTPFEDFRTPADLGRVTYASWKSFSDEVQTWYDGSLSLSRGFLATVEQALVNPATVGANVALYLTEQAEAEAAAAFRASVNRGLQNCRDQLRETHPDLPYYDSSNLADTVIGLQDTKTGDILVLGVYLTTMAELQIAAHAEKQQQA